MSETAAPRPPGLRQDDFVTPWAGCLNLTGGVVIRVGDRYFKLVELPDPRATVAVTPGPPAGGGPGG